MSATNCRWHPFSWLRAKWQRWRRQRRLARILEACGITVTLYSWQKHFILDEKAVYPFDALKRRTGKTLAMILRTLVWDPPIGTEMLKMLELDPDAGATAPQLRWTWQEYRKYAIACKNAGIRFRWQNLDDKHFRAMLVARSSLGK